MRRLIQKLSLWFLTLTITILFLNLLIDNPYSRRVLHAYLKKYIWSEMQVEFYAAHLRPSFFPLGFTAQNVVLKSPKCEHPFLTISDTRLDLSWPSLILAKPTISLLSLFEAKFHDRYLPSTPDSTLQMLPWPPLGITLKKAKVQSSSMSWDFKKDNNETLTLTAGGLDAELDFKDWFYANISIDARELDFYANEVPVLKKTVLSYRGQFQDASITSTVLTIQDERFSAQGALSMGLHWMQQGRERAIVGIDLSSELKAKCQVATLGDFLGISKNAGHIGGAISLNAFINLGTHQQSAFSLFGDIKSDQGRLGGYQLFQSEAQVYLDSQGIAFDKLRLIIDEKTYAHLDGSILFADPVSYDFKGSIHDLSFENLMKSVELPFEAFNATLSSKNFHLTGTSKPFHMDVKADTQINHLAFKAFAAFPEFTPNCHSSLHLSLNTHQLMFDKAQGTCIHKELAASSTSFQLTGGLIYDQQTKIHIDLKPLNASLLSPIIDAPLNGHGQARITVTDTPNKATRIDITSQLDQLSINNHDLGTGRFDGYFENQKIAVNQAFLKHPTQEVHITNSYFNVLTKDYGIKGFAKNTDSTTVSLLLNRFTNKHLSFSVKHLEADMTGNLTQPLLIQGNLLADLGPTYLQDRFFSQGIHLKATGSPKESILKECEFFQKNHKIICGGKITLGTTTRTPYGLGIAEQDHIAFYVKTQQTAHQSANHMATIPYFGQNIDANILTAGLIARGSVHGTPKDLNGDIDIQLHHPYVTQKPLADIHIKGFIQKSHLTGFISHDGDGLTGRLSLPFMQDKPFDGFVNFKQLDLRFLMPSPQFSDPRNYIFANGTWHIKGYLHELHNVEGVLELHEVKGLIQQTNQTEFLAPIMFQSSEPVHVYMTAKGWHSNHKPLHIQGTWGEAFGVLHPSLLPDQLNVSIDGTLQLDVLSQFVKAIDKAHGVAEIKATLSGSVKHPNVWGTIKNDSSENKPSTENKLAIIFIPSFAPEIRDLVFDMEFNTQHLLIKKLYGKKGNGNFQITGSIPLTQEDPTTNDVHILLDRLNVVYNLPYLKTFDVTMSGDLALKTQTMPWLLSGEITLDRARSLRNFDIRDEVVKAIKKATLIKNTKHSSQPTITFDIFVKGQESIVINNKTLKSSLSSNLHILGNNEEPKLEGNLEVLGGKFLYKKEFTLVKGDLSFESHRDLDPDLHISAFADISPYRLWIIVSGKASEPVVELVVDPPTRDDGTVISRLDAIVLLSRGALPKLENHNVESQNVGVSEAINIYASQLPFDKLVELSGQNYLQPYIDSTTDENGAPVPQLNVPFKFKENVDVVLQKTPSKTSISVELPINENIYFSGNQTSYNKDAIANHETEQDNRSLDLKFRFSVK